MFPLGAAMLETDDAKKLRERISTGYCAVLFYATWCQDCHNFMPVFDSASARSKIPVLKARIDADSNPIWEDFKIEVVPTVVLFENGREKLRAEERGRGISQALLKKMLG